MTVTLTILLWVIWTLVWGFVAAAGIFLILAAISRKSQVDVDHLGVHWKLEVPRAAWRAASLAAGLTMVGVFALYGVGPYAFSRSPGCGPAADHGDLTGTEKVVSGTGGKYLHVEFYARSGDPEKETILPLDSQTYRLLAPLRGHVWEYPDSCSLADVLNQVWIHIGDRIDEGHNNSGAIAEWRSTGYFEPAH